MIRNFNIHKCAVHGPFCAEATCTHRQLGTQTVGWFKGQSFMVSQVVLAQHGPVTANLWMLKLLIKDPFKRFQRQLAGSSWPVLCQNNLTNHERLPLKPAFCLGPQVSMRAGGFCAKGAMDRRPLGADIDCKGARNVSPTSTSLRFMVRVAPQPPDSQCLPLSHMSPLSGIPGSS